MSRHSKQDTVRWVNTHGDVTRISGTITETLKARPYVGPKGNAIPKHAKKD